MIDFRIVPLNGKCHEKHYTVQAKNRLTDDWIFIQSFRSRQNALDFIYYVKRRIARGDFSCLTTKT